MMCCKRLTWLASVGLVCTLIWLANPLRVEAQRSKDSPGDQPREVTLTGRIVDLQNYMTEKWLSSDHKKCTADCIRAGVPIGLEVGKAVYVIGHGHKNPAEKVLPFAYQEVEIKGKVTEKHGLKYLDLTSISSLEEEEQPEDPWKDRDFDDDEEE